jgi:hypothetical protein
MPRVHHGFGMPVFLLVLGVALAAAVPTFAEGLDALESAFVREHLRLEQVSQRYFAARDRDREALEALDQLCVRMDQALIDENVPIDELQALEEQLGIARETAMERLRTSSQHRRKIIGHLDDLEQLGQKIEQQKDYATVELDPALVELDQALMELDDLGGVWEVEGSTAFDAAFGLMKLDVNGATVKGTYRMSTGTHGSLHGTIINDGVRLQRVDTEHGNDLVLEGTIDRAGGEMSGTWQSKILGTGRPENGEWSARKLSPSEVQELEYNRR